MTRQSTDYPTNMPIYTQVSIPGIRTGQTMTGPYSTTRKKYTNSAIDPENPQVLFNKPDYSNVIGHEATFYLTHNDGTPSVAVHGRICRVMGRDKDILELSDCTMIPHRSDGSIKDFLLTMHQSVNLKNIRVPVDLISQHEPLI